MKKKILAVLLIILCLSAVVVFAGCEMIIQAIFGSGQNPDPNGENPNEPPKHTHTMTHVSSEQPTCTGEGAVEYWHCSGCDKYFADEKGENEIADIKIVSTGHLPTIQAEAAYHYQKCEYCGETIGEQQPHSSNVWARNKNQHYKVCDVCARTFNGEDHTFVNNECTVCKYFTNYAERCSSSYGYEFFGTLKNGEKYQAYYNELDKVISAFHDNANANATRKSTDSGYRYVCSGVNYSTAGLTQNEAISVWATYRNDHPLYYWMLGNVMYTSKEIITCVDFNYANGADRVAKNAELYEVIDDYLNVVKEETSAYQIALGLHDEIINNISYARDNAGAPIDEAWAHGILGVFDRKQAVCDGYSRAFQLLLSARNIKSAFVTGVAVQGESSEGHAWNMAEIEGKWYWFDLTWDDQPHFAGGIIYDYFCKAGTSFNGHQPSVTNNFNDAINYLYGLPTPGANVYNGNNAIGKTFNSGNFTYEISGYHKVIVTNCTGIGNVAIPKNITFNGIDYNVNEIGTDAFKNNVKITKLTIPSTVTIINNFAFNGCALLSEIVFEDATGWTRTSQGTTTAITAAQLADSKQAAALLKETYISGGRSWQYVWEKK